MTEEAKASGISRELTETDKLLEQIIEMFEESDREGGENLQQVEQNKENERKKAEEMRNRSMEKLAETLKRKAADDGQVNHKKRGSGTETLVYLREKAEKQVGGEEERTVSTNADVSSYATATAATTTTANASTRSAAAAAKSNAAGTN